MSSISIEWFKELSKISTAWGLLGSLITLVCVSSTVIMLIIYKRKLFWSAVGVSILAGYYYFWFTNITPLLNFGANLAVGREVKYGWDILKSSPNGTGFRSMFFAALCFFVYYGYQSILYRPKKLKDTRFFQRNFQNKNQKHKKTGE